ncbi:MAG: hypothetical protein NTY20_03765 [Candidatus Aenigmarchaeota archaeon]|nr:hypothetical protein [Candidatus Aenigmarchaeota archaeon]
MKGSMIKNLAIVLTVFLFAVAGYMIATAEAPEGCGSFICRISYNILPLLMIAFALMLMVSLTKLL